MNVNFACGCHMLHTDVSVTILISIRAYMTVMMNIVFHRHFERKTWRTNT